MSWELEQSLKIALTKKKWIYGDKYFRIGNPFAWVDGDLQISRMNFSGVVDLKQWFSGYYEKYETLRDFKYKDYNKDYKIILNCYKNIFDFYFPFYKKKKDTTLLKNIICHSLARIQDYCVIKKYTSLRKNSEHLDFGPGLGGNAVYSLRLLKSKYTGIEAHYWSYDIQRLFFRKLINSGEIYTDLLSAESLGMNDNELKSIVNDKTSNIKQIPSWHFDFIKNNTKDLITATTCLNELNTAGIIYFLYHSNRVLKKNGYLYIRDSAKLKPGRHNVNYDNILTNIFEYKLVKDFRHLTNRKDIFALPRIYKKQKIKNFSFEKLYNKLVGYKAITAHGSVYNQNLKEKNKK